MMTCASCENAERKLQKPIKQKRDDDPNDKNVASKVRELPAKELVQPQNIEFRSS